MSARMVRADEAVLVLIDMQQRLADSMPDRDPTLASAALLASAAGVLGIPVLVTRQYPAGLGDTTAELCAAVGPHQPVDKTAFDCMAEPVFASRLAATARTTVVVAGMETHICVTQTALSLIGAGYSVHVVADAVCSRCERDRDVALHRLRAAGVVVTTVESVLYEALGKADTPLFREVLELVKTRQRV